MEQLIGKHPSFPYNPDIANVFYLAGFIENWGRGVEKICSTLKSENLPMPEYTVHKKIFQKHQRRKPITLWVMGGALFNQRH